MAFRLNNGRFLTGFALAVFMLAAAGCQSGDAGGVLGLGGNKQEKQPEEGKILASELLAYCPRVTLKEDTGYINNYVKGGEDDPAKLTYQASISEVTRSCSRAGWNADDECCGRRPRRPWSGRCARCGDPAHQDRRHAGRRGLSTRNCTIIRSRPAAGRSSSSSSTIRPSRSRTRPTRAFRSLPASTQGRRRRSRTRTQPKSKAGWSNSRKSGNRYSLGIATKQGSRRRTIRTAPRSRPGNPPSA